MVVVGETLSGTYRVSELVGGGAFADVYLGRDLRTNTVVALKILHPHFGRDPSVVQRFLQEARTAYALTDPHIVRVLDAGQDGDTYYIVMEYVQGHTLAHLVQARGPLPIAEAIDYIDQVLQALGEAHRAGVVHRDIKPANLMVTTDGLVKVMDFGIAKIEAAGTMTQAGQYLGTPQYMSPEQAKGEHADARSDLYAVAATLFELLTGRPPFNAENPWDVLRQQMTAEPPLVRSLRADVPTPLERTLAQGLEKNPPRRFQTAAQFQQALGRLVGGPNATARPRPDVRHSAWLVRRGLRRIPAPAMAAGIAIVGVALLVLTSANRSGILTAADSQPTGSPGFPWAWGYGYMGGPRPPAQIVGSSPQRFVAVATAHDGPSFMGLGLRQDGTVLGWDHRVSYRPNENGECCVGGYDFKLLDGLRDVRAIDAGPGYGLALRRNGTVWTWGSRTPYCIPELECRARESPAQIAELDDVSQIAAGDGFSIVLKRDGTVWAWGRGGDGSENSFASPVQVRGVVGMKSIVAGGIRAMAIGLTGRVWVWGLGRLPAELPDLSDVKALAAGGDHSMALTADGSVWTWGSIWDSRQGVNLLSLSPTKVPGVDNIIAIATGSSHFVALRRDGTVWAWGDNSSGQLGIVSEGEIQMLPGKVPVLEGVTAIAAGDQGNVAISSKFFNCCFDNHGK